MKVNAFYNTDDINLSKIGNIKKIALWFLLGIILVCYGYATWRISQGNLIDTDFGKFYNSAKLFFAGKDVYSGNVDLVQANIHLPHIKHVHLTNLSTPPLVLLTLPLAYLSYGTAFIVWTLLNFLIIGITLNYLAKTLFEAKKIVLAVSFLLFYPTLIALLAGQVTFILLGLLVASWHYGRQSKMILAGFLLGLAFSLKIFFGLFAIFLLITCEWKALFGFLAAALIACLLSIAGFGSSIFSGYQQVINEVHWYATNWNVSWFGFMARLFPIAPSLEGNVTIFHNAFYGKLLLLAGYAIVLTGMFRFIKPFVMSDKTKQKYWDVGFAYATVGMTLLSPLGWWYYFPLLVLPFLIMAQRLKSLPSSELSLLALAVVLFLSSIPSAVALPSQMQNATHFIISGTLPVLAQILLLMVIYISYPKIMSNDVSRSNTVRLNWYYGIGFIPTAIAWLKIIGQI